MRLKLLVVMCSIPLAGLLGAETGWAQTAEGDVGVPANVVSEAVAATSPHRPSTIANGSLERAVDREVRRLMYFATSAYAPFRAAQQLGRQNRGWIGRHPALFGALIGCSGGFLIGYLAGDDAIFDDFSKGFHGVGLGGVGALTGAIVGELASTP